MQDIQATPNHLHAKILGELEFPFARRPHQSVPDSPRLSPTTKNLNTKNQVYIRKRVCTSPQNPLTTSIDSESPSTTPKIKRVSSQGQFSSFEGSPRDDRSDAETIKISDYKLARYENIAAITCQENENLRQQNKYLLAELRKMKKREERAKNLYLQAKKYKQLAEETRYELQIVTQQKSVHKQCLSDLAEISCTDIPILRQKVIEAHSDEPTANNTKMAQHKARHAQQNQKYKLESPAKPAPLYQGTYEAIKEETEDEISVRTSHRGSVITPPAE